MEQKRSKLVFMRILGVLTLASVFQRLYYIVSCVLSHKSINNDAPIQTISSVCSIGWYVEYGLIALLSVFVGLGFLLRRNWARVLFLYTTPLLMGYAFVLNRMYGMAIAAYVILLIFQSAIVLYFFRQRVRLSVV